MEITPTYAAKRFFSNPTFTQIFFEAIANSLDANAKKLFIKITCDGNIEPNHMEITVTDDGEGFTDERFARFARIDEPKDPFHKGLGRLVFLRYFSAAHINSVFDGQERSFVFSNAFSGQSELQPISGTIGNGTTIKLSQFTGDRLKSFDNVRPEYLKKEIIQHFLPRFHEIKKNGEQFNIGIELEIQGGNQRRELIPDAQSISTKDIPELTTITFKDETIDAFSEISVSYSIESGMGEKNILTAACIDGRTINLNLISPAAVPMNHSLLFLFKSDLFSERSDSARQRLLLPENLSETYLYRFLREKVSEILSENLPEIEEKNATTKKTFEERFPHLTGYFDKDTVGIIDKDEALEIAQSKFFKSQKEILESDSLDDRTFRKSLEISSRTLTEYILYRELIIKRMGEITDKNKEVDIHELIVPRYRKYRDDALIEGIYSNNAWLLDDKFMSFRTILSETRMRDVISEITLGEETINDDGRPDISMIFSADPKEAEKVDVVVIEIKRRRADDKEAPYAATQLLKRARRLVDHCPNIQRVWYYGIIEIDRELQQMLKDDGWVQMFSKGQVFHKDRKLERADGEIVLAPTTLLSFDAIIDDAAARNHTFLEILKNDMRRANSTNSLTPTEPVSS